MRTILIISLYFLFNKCSAQVFTPLGNGFNNAVRCISIDTTNNIVYAGGNFTFSGSIPLSGIAKWNGSIWGPLGIGNIYPGDPVNASIMFQNALICDGTFSDGIDTTGDGIGLWTGGSWMNIGNVNSSSGPGGIVAFKNFGGLIYMMGDFVQINGASYNQLATWDGSTYTGFPVIDTLPSYVNTCQLFNNDLYVGGKFGSQTNSQIKDICRFDGASWQPVGNGLNGLMSWVNCMTVFQGDLYVAGWFSESLGDPGNNIARWDGSSWHSLGSGVDYSIFTMEVFNNELYVGGQFTNAGGIPANKLARWNGTQWDSVPNANFNNSVLCLKTFNNELYIGGGFTMMNGNPVNFIGKYSTITGLEDNNQDYSTSIVVFPKISTGNFNVKLGQLSLENVEISDIYGNNITVRWKPNYLHFDISENSPGVYFVRLTTQLGITTHTVFLIN